jgi:hypothetical protein
MLSGGVALVLTLFLQPLEPVQFIELAFRASFSGLNASILPTATAAFWGALVILFLGLTGMLLRTLRRRTDQSIPEAQSHGRGNQEKSEEDWIFI